MPFQRKRTMDVLQALVGQEAGRLVLGHYTAEDAAAEALDAALPSHVAINK